MNYHHYSIEAIVPFIKIWGGELDLVTSKRAKGDFLNVLGVITPEMKYSEGWLLSPSFRIV